MEGPASARIREGGGSGANERCPSGMGSWVGEWDGRFANRPYEMFVSYMEGWVPAFARTREGELQGEGVALRGNNGRGVRPRGTPLRGSLGMAMGDGRFANRPYGGGEDGSPHPRGQRRGSFHPHPNLPPSRGKGWWLDVYGALGAGDSPGASGVGLQGVSERLGQGLEDSFRFVVTVLSLPALARGG